MAGPDALCPAFTSTFAWQSSLLTHTLVHKAVGEAQEHGRTARSRRPAALHTMQCSLFLLPVPDLLCACTDDRANVQGGGGRSGAGEDEEEEEARRPVRGGRPTAPTKPLPPEICRCVPGVSSSGKAVQCAVPPCMCLLGSKTTKLMLQGTPCLPETGRPKGKCSALPLLQYSAPLETTELILALAQLRCQALQHAALFLTDCRCTVLRPQLAERLAHPVCANLQP